MVAVKRGQNLSLGWRNSTNNLMAAETPHTMMALCPHFTMETKYLLFAEYWSVKQKKIMGLNAGGRIKLIRKVLHFSIDS